MANDLNKVILIGRLTRDPELKYTQANTAVAHLSIANNRTFVQNGEKKEQVSFFDCVAWGKTGEVIAQYCKKGKQIAIDGRLQQRSWEDKEGKKRSSVEITIENFQFLGSSGQSGDYSSGSSEADIAESRAIEASLERTGSVQESDDIPF